MPLMFSPVQTFLAHRTVITTQYAIYELAAQLARTAQARQNN